jgi:hypothetical protein
MPPLDVPGVAPDPSVCIFSSHEISLNQSEYVKRSFAGHRALACRRWDFVTARATLYRHRNPPSNNAAVEKVAADTVTETLQLPQWISSRIPYIGHVLGYVQDGHGYFAALW